MRPASSSLAVVKRRLTASLKEEESDGGGWGLVDVVEMGVVEGEVEVVVSSASSLFLLLGVVADVVVDVEVEGVLLLLASEDVSVVVAAVLVAVEALSHISSPPSPSLLLLPSRINSTAGNTR